MRSILATVLVLAAATAAGEEPMAMISLYVLEPHREAEFAAGYQEHLRWHVAASDTWAWYVWRVATGDRQGQFIGASLPHPWSALGLRPRPGEDRADHERTIDPHLASAQTRLVALRPDLGGTLPPLESRPLVLAFEATVPASGRAAFEDALRSRRAVAREHGWGEVRSGGTLPAYLLLVPLDGPAAMDGLRFESFAGSATALVTALRAETWSFRRELSTCHHAESQCLGLAAAPGR